jgi:hypothetical protein
VDETWIHHYTPETKQQSKQWIGAGESVPKKAKTVPSAGKVMAAVFWDSRGVVLIDYLQKAVHTSSRQHNILYLGLDIGPLILHTNSRQGKNAPQILDSNSRQKKILVIESTVTKVRFNDESPMF